MDKCSIPEEFVQFCQTQNIKLVETDVGFNQEPFIVMDGKRVREVIDILLGKSFVRI